eukprot:1147541-Pelagomonas_calceolata.AAC.1
MQPYFFHAGPPLTPPSPLPSKWKFVAFFQGALRPYRITGSDATHSHSGQVLNNDLFPHHVSARSLPSFFKEDFKMSHTSSKKCTLAQSSLCLEAPNAREEIPVLKGMHIYLASKSPLVRLLLAELAS